MAEVMTAPGTREQEEIMTPLMRIKLAVKEGKTLQGVHQKLQEHLDELHPDDGQDTEMLRDRMEAIEQLLSKFGSVQVAKLPAGVLGMAPVGGTIPQIHLSSDLVETGSFKKLQEVCVHEEGHILQKKLKEKAEGKAVLFTETKKVKSVDVLYEGHTERRQEKVTGEGRDDRPEELYQKGYDLFKDELEEKHGDEVERAMTGDGDLEALQNDIWREGTETGDLSSEDLMKQSEETGYKVSEEVIAVQIEKWLVLVEKGEADREEVLEQVQRLDREKNEEEAKKTIREIYEKIRGKFENGPETDRRRRKIRSGLSASVN